MSTGTPLEPTDLHGESYWALHGLPPFPAVATQLLRLLANDEVETRELVDLVRADPMLASELLHTVNSARYALRKEINSIQHAVMILGRETLQSFAIAVSLRMYLGPAIQQEALARVWRHSIAAAEVCDLLAKSSGDRSQGKDTAYVAGLLHNVGCLGLMAVHPKKYAEALELAASQGRDVREVERELFEIDHCEAGRWIARAWRFSPEIEEVAFRHHLPPENGFALLELVKIGVLLADSLGWEIVPSGESLAPPEVLALLPPAVRNGIKVQPDEIRKLIEDKISSFGVAKESGRPNVETAKRPQPMHVTVR
jgi:HD-like signal output (HDOD) protein